MSSSTKLAREDKAKTQAALEMQDSLCNNERRHIQCMCKLMRNGMTALRCSNRRDSFPSQCLILYYFTIEQ